MHLAIKSFAPVGAMPGIAVGSAKAERARCSPVAISVVTATLNAAATLEGCLHSVRQQRHTRVEHVVVDGLSQDGTQVILERHRRHLSALVSEPDGGIYQALNKGLSLCSGDVVGFLHADDVFAGPEVLAAVARAFEDPAVSAVYGDLQYVRAQDPTKVVRHWRAGEFNERRLAWGWMPPHPTLYVRRDWYQRIGGFDASYKIAGDYLSVLQLFSQPDFRAVYLPQVMVKMRTGGASNRSLANIARKTREDWLSLRRVRRGISAGVGALAWKNLSKLGQFGHSG